VITPALHEEVKKEVGNSLRPNIIKGLSKNKYKELP